MNISNFRIGARLATGFGILMLLTAVLLIVGVTNLSEIGRLTDNVIKKEWGKADAAHTVNALTRENARRTMELFIVDAPEDVNKIDQAITANKKAITETLLTLERLVETESGQQIVARIKDAREAFVASFSKVAQFLSEGRRLEAAALMREETLPLLDTLQGHVDRLVVIQSTLVKESGESARQGISFARVVMIAVGLAAFLLSIPLAWWITTSITKPIRHAVKAAQQVASGDLTCRIEMKSQDETGHLLQALQEMNESLVKIVGEVRARTETVATASSQIASGNMDLSSRTEAQASSLEETASSMEELTSTVKQNADNACQANALAVTACKAAIIGGEVVAKVVDTMVAINASAKKMEEIIGVIDGIAFQTNILALNAAVEAARAGEQGRGFAVVALEVRSLAQRSAVAAKEIKALIIDSAERIDAGSDLAGDAGAAMEEIVIGVKRVTDIMNEIAAAGSEQTAGLEQINQAIAHMDEVTQQNAALVEESAAAAQALQEQASNLAGVVRIFTLPDAGTSHAALPADATHYAADGSESDQPSLLRGRPDLLLPA